MLNSTAIDFYTKRFVSDCARVEQEFDYYFMKCCGILYGEGEQHRAAFMNINTARCSDCGRSLSTAHGAGLCKPSLAATFFMAALTPPAVLPDLYHQAEQLTRDSEMKL